MLVSVVFNDARVTVSSFVALRFVQGNGDFTVKDIDGIKEYGTSRRDFWLWLWIVNMIVLLV
jgi:hypothetical protein